MESELQIDDSNDASDGLSMMEPEVHSDGTIVDVTGQRSSIRQTACKIQHTVLFTPKFRRRTRELVGFQDCANQGIDCMKIDIS